METVEGSTPVLVRRDGPLVFVTLNRPHALNALTDEMCDRLLDVLRGVEVGPDRVLILAGAGKGFCAGADRSVLENLSPPAGTLRSRTTAMQHGNAVVQALHDLSLPTIAAVHGVAAGGGCSLALACDLIYASPEAKFVELFVNRGLSVDLGSSWLLPRLIGLARAKEMAFTGESVSAERAASIGLVTDVVASDQLQMRVLDVALGISRWPKFALAATKQMINDSVSRTLGEALRVETLAQSLNLAEPWPEPEHPSVPGH